MILDIGCGLNKREGAVGVDIALLPTVDVVHDINKTLPFEDNSIEGIYIFHTLEHVDDFIHVMEELYRVCKSGAWIEIRVPHCSAPAVAWGDPTHKRAFSLATFAPFYEDSNLKHYSNARFTVLEQRLFVGLGGKIGTSTNIRHKFFHTFLKFAEKMANKSKASQIRAERYWAHWIGFAELYIKLEAIKRQ